MLSHTVRRACCELLEARRLLSFSSAVNHPVGTSPQDIVTADFNGDGKLDLATVNTGSHNVSVLLGNGAGGFGAAQQFAGLPYSPVSFAVADFNGDNKLDLVAAGGSGSLAFILKGNGDGTFQSAVPFGGPAFWTVLEAAAGDFNGDNKMDLVVSETDDGFSGEGGAVYVLLGNGQGGVTSTWFGGVYPRYGLSVDDVNGDSRLDVVTAGYTLLGNGNGTLSQPSQNGGFSSNPDYFPRAAAIGELTGDGIVDLVLAGASVQVLSGLGFAGTVLPANATTFYTAVATADFNGDGKLDAVATYSGADVWLGNGDGTLQNPAPFPTGAGPAAIAVGDFNGDGLPDVATANGGSNNISVLLNDGIWPTKTWTGPVSGNWSTAANWSPSGVPGIADQVLIAGSNVNLAGSSTIAGLTLTGGATLSVGANGSRVLRTSAVSIVGNSRLDLRDNFMIIDYSGASPMATVRAALNSGYANGAWNGNGISSSSAAAGGNTALGYAEASSLSTIPPIFGGVDATAVLIRYTRYGDADLSASVDLNDFNRLAGSFGQSDTVWSRGNFTYDNVTNLSDFNLLATTFGQSVAPEIFSAIAIGGKQSRSLDTLRDELLA